MYKLIIIITLIFLSHNSIAQTDTNNVDFIAYWSIGDSYDFNVSKIIRKWENDTLVKNDTTRYKANFQVIDSTSNSYSIKWSFDNYIAKKYNETLSESFSDKESLKKIVSKYDLSSINYTTDEYGEFISILDWEEFGNAMSSMIAEIVNQGKLKYPERADKIEKAIAPLAEIYSSREGIESLILMEIQFFHFPLGGTYSIDVPFEYEQELPNMLGGEPLRANARLSIEEMDGEEYYCVLKEVVEINNDDAKNLTTELLVKMGFNEEQVGDMINKSIFDINDLNYYQFYYQPGIPHRIYGARTFDLDMSTTKFKQINEIEIDLIYKE